VARSNITTGTSQKHQWQAQMQRRMHAKNIQSVLSSSLAQLEAGFAAHNFHLLRALGKKKGKLIRIELYYIDFNYGLSSPMQIKFNKINEEVNSLIRKAAQQLEI
jgi:hypothetical protein